MSYVSKYRRLSIQELEDLQNEFITFIALHGIDANKWADMKLNEPKKVDDLICQFSDAVIEKVLKKVKFLNFLSPTLFSSCQIGEMEMQMIGLESYTINLSPLRETILESFIGNFEEGSFKIFYTQKSYGEDKLKDIFHLMQSGMTISDGAEFKTLSMIWANQKNSN